VNAELVALRKLALHVAEPVGESFGLGERSPEVVDSGVEAIMHPHYALAIDRMQTPKNGHVASHLVPPLLAFQQSSRDLRPRCPPSRLRGYPVGVM
jgi:hypothetical protein